MNLEIKPGVTINAGVILGPLFLGKTPTDAITNNTDYTGPYHTITAKPRPTTTRSFTVEGWVKWDNTASSCVGSILGSPSDRIRQPHFLGIFINDWYSPRSTISVDGYYQGQNSYQSPVDFINNVWYHIAVSRDATNNDVEAVWVNGVRCGGTKTNHRVLDYNSLMIGNGWPNAENDIKFVGYQTDIRIISNAYVYNPTSSTITVPTTPLTTTSNCIALIQSNATGALATDNSGVGQSLSFLGLSHRSDSPYIGGAGGSWFNPDGNGSIVMDPGVYNC
jgi:hypothetical protein